MLRISVDRGDMYLLRRAIARYWKHLDGCGAESRTLAGGLMTAQLNLIDSAQEDVSTFDLSSRVQLEIVDACSMIRILEYSTGVDKSGADFVARMIADIKRASDVFGISPERLRQMATERETLALADGVEPELMIERKLVARLARKLAELLEPAV